ncbi:thioredoxin family protein [Polaribacter reichenbachii]|uniref:Redoxin n=1 Tax=Polaribacter reichenbachii TaxID=996801 RepID=A0A1B8TRE2_9FLAO|nr:thioredoxin family protein [Polaribacter reichenbachii]APZ47747.1 thioredoxin family protein [Polaribacter reichenbachii]AUC18382.1 thioredoxin family protein [Polaribacter reichenbachii]OBY62266.1 redoxin [Polaribacter reichenbachii]
MKTIKNILLLAVVVITATAFTLKSDSGYQIGDKIEDFKLKNVDGDFLSLSDYDDAKGYIIIFTCNTCPYSVANEDRIIALNDKYEDEGYPVIAINPNNPEAVADESFEKMKVRSEEKNFNFPYLLDEGQKVYPKFGATKTPHVFIVTKNDMKVKYIGAIDNSSRNPDAVTEKYVEDAVDALLAGKTVEKTETRAIGCSIKV